MWLTLRPDRLGDRAGVTEAVRVDRPHDEKINGVGEEPDHRVPLVPYMVRHRLPGAAHRLAAERRGKKKKQHLIITFLLNRTDIATERRCFDLFSLPFE